MDLIYLLLCFSAVRAVVFDPSSFSQERHWGGVGACTKMIPAGNGEVFCGLKNGAIVKWLDIDVPDGNIRAVWSAPPDLTSTWNDRGLLGMAVDPEYPKRPFIWVLMSVNRGPKIDDETPAMPNPGVCPAGDGGGVDGSCDASARLIRIKINADGLGTTDQVLFSGWCSNGCSHHLGNIAWARDGGLYLTGGDGSSYTVPDRGTKGARCHVDGDPRPQGAWRAQWDEFSHGKLLHISKENLMKNSYLELGKDVQVLARGLRNPFRFAIHPVTYDIYVGDVGSDFYEEINLIPDPLNPENKEIPNFGWPCYEGKLAQPVYGADAGCPKDLKGTYRPPFISYSRNKGFNIPGAQEHCMRGSVSPAAFAFRNGTIWGSKWENRLFWADSSMQCIFVLANDDKGKPDPDVDKMKLISYNEDKATNGKWCDLVFVEKGGDSAMYAVDFDQSGIWKFKYQGPRDGAPAKSSALEHLTSFGGLIMQIVFFFLAPAIIG